MTLKSGPNGNELPTLVTLLRWLYEGVGKLLIGPPVAIMIRFAKLAKLNYDDDDNDGDHDDNGITNFDLDQ